MAPASSSSSRRLAATPTRVEDEGYCLPPFSSNPGDEEILRQLPPLLQRYRSVGHTGVNAGVPWWDPWNIPGMPLDEEEDKIREKYFVTDCSALKSSSTNPATQTGYWKPRDLGWGIPAGEGIGPAQVSGLKTTYDFHIGNTIYEEVSKGTSWIMDVYFLINHRNGYHQIEDDLVICHVFKGSRDYDARPKCAAHHSESPKEKGSLNPYHFQEQSLINQCDPNNAEIHAQSNNALLERPAGFLATHIDSNKDVSPPDHTPQIEYVSHHQASKENGSLAAHQQGFQLPNHGCNQNNTGEPNHQAVGQNNDHFDTGLLHEVLNRDMEEVADHAFDPISTYFGNMEGVDDIDAFLCQSRKDLANENTGIEISMEMIDDDMPNGVVSSTVPVSAENGPLGKRARTKSPAWDRFTKLFTITKTKAALAVCNHCYKVMTGDSSKGTSHLNRHKCHCNCKH